MDFMVQKLMPSRSWTHYQLFLPNLQCNSTLLWPMEVLLFT